MTTNPPDMKIRISAVLRRQIEDAAKRNNRTMNGEISARLERSFDAATVPTGHTNPVIVEPRAYDDGEVQRRLKALEDEVGILRKKTGR